MASFEKVTSDANELVFGTLLDGYRRLTIPLFQRSYKWGTKEYTKFIEDLDAIVFGDASTRFIGAIVAVERNTGPNVPTEYEVVDGQQRLFTIYLTIAAAAYVIAKRGDPEDAAILMRRYLFIPDYNSAGGNTKLSTSLDDSAEFAELWKRLLSLSPLATSVAQSKPKAPPAVYGDKQSGTILAQFDRLLKWLDSVWKESRQSGINAYVTAATSNLSFVWLSLQDPESAPRIFESLNNRGVRTTVGDLVRNEVFARLRHAPDDARDLYDGAWKDFRESLKGHYEEFFFPYGLIANRNTRKNELFAALRSGWEGRTDAAAIISDMQQFVPAFLAVSLGHPPAGTSIEVNKQIRNFSRLRLPSSVYPFLMQLIKQQASGNADAVETSKMLALVESFLVRRALCGYEPTGLHAAFKGLWHDLNGTITADQVEMVLRKRKTVQWPSDDQVKQCVAERPLYGSSVASYALTEYDRSLGGDVPTDVSEIEHVLPQRLSKDWAPLFTTELHSKLRHTWANLIPISPPMNKGLQQGLYEAKRERFMEDSMYKTPRSVAKAYDVWNTDTLADRATVLGAFAVDRWSY
ncbi:MAG TPA: DUF262 domain-containing protein [Rhodothermales bacterium]|nr:DUF262 domain-containing protein [Rhodothermales bacterium]